MVQIGLNLTLLQTASVYAQRSLFPVLLQKHENSTPTWTKHDAAISETVQCYKFVDGFNNTRRQVAQLWLTDRATAYVRKVHCAVVSTASGSVQGEMP